MKKLVEEKTWSKNIVLSSMISVVSTWAFALSPFESLVFFLILLLVYTVEDIRRSIKGVD